MKQSDQGIAWGIAAILAWQVWLLCHVPTARGESRQAHGYLYSRGHAVLMGMDTEAVSTCQRSFDQELFSRGRVFFVPSGAPVQALVWFRDQMQVRVVAGPAFGKVGWISAKDFRPD